LVQQVPSMKNHIDQDRGYHESTDRFVLLLLTGTIKTNKIPG